MQRLEFLDTKTMRIIRSKSFLLTLLFHGFLIVALLFAVLRTPIPPFEGGEGMIVNIGYVDMASGEEQPMSEVTTTLPQPEQIKPQKTNPQEEKILTQDIEDAPVIENKPKKENTKAEIKPKQNTSAVTPKETPKEPVKTVDPRSIYKGKTTISTSQGTATQGKGDQGAPSGDPNSAYYGKAGTGTGVGEGDGKGPGSGDGTGGISYNLSGRNLVRKPSIDDSSQETGKVVVDITVNKDGTVINARPGARGTTTTSSLLFSKAKEAALKAKFNPSSAGVEEQKGTITFVFVVK